SRFGLGLFLGGILPAANSLIARRASPEERGKVFSFTHSAVFWGNFAGPLFGGIGASLFGIRIMLGVTALFFLINLLWVKWKVEELPAVAADSGSGAGRA